MIRNIEIHAVWAAIGLLVAAGVFVWVLLRFSVSRSGDLPEPPAGVRARNGRSYKETVQKQVSGR